MERILITAFYTLLSAVFGLIIMILSFGAAWGGIAGLIFSVLIGISCFFVTWFLTGIIDRYWYMFSAAVGLPTLALHTEILIENLKLGHIPAVIAIPLIVTVTASIAGGYSRRKRNKKENAENNAGETAGNRY